MELSGWKTAAKVAVYVDLIMLILVGGISFVKVFEKQESDIITLFAVLLICTVIFMDVWVAAFLLEAIKQISTGMDVANAIKRAGIWRGVNVFLLVLGLVISAETHDLMVLALSVFLRGWLILIMTMFMGELGLAALGRYPDGTPVATSPQTA